MDRWIRIGRIRAPHARGAADRAGRRLHPHEHQGPALPHPRTREEVSMERRAGEHLASSMIMENEWDKRYQSGETPWEKGRAHPELVAFLRRQPLNGCVLVPGCGHGHDARALAACADEVVG